MNIILAMKALIIFAILIPILESCPDFPPVPKAATFEITSYGNDLKVLRYSCQSGYYLLGQGEFYCEGDSWGIDPLPICALDITQHERVKVKMSSGVFEEKAVDGNEDFNHKGRHMVILHIMHMKLIHIRVLDRI